MNDGMLSQEEIEALLRGESLDDMKTVSSSKQTQLNVDDYLDSFEQDALGEIGNISFGSSATALSSLLGQKVEITTPSISMINRANLEDEFPHPYVAIQVKYTSGLEGMNLLVIKQSDAAVIADLMLGGDGTSPNDDLNEIQLSAVQEAMNQMMGSAATSMSTVFNKKVDISPPSINLLNIKEDEGKESIPEEDLLVKVSFNLRVGNLIDSDIMQLQPLIFAKSIVSSLMNDQEEEVAVTAYEESPATYTQPAEQSPFSGNAYEQQAQPQYVQQPPQQQAPRKQMQQVEVQSAQFASFETPTVNPVESRNLNMLYDIPLQVTVELGRTKRSVKDILELTGGSIIELDKLAGEPVDILVNSRLIAKGEVVVIDENFGVRITDIVSQADRLNNLR